MNDKQLKRAKIMKSHSKKEHIIVLDTETTGLERKDKSNLSIQPYIVEYAAIKLDWETLEEVDRFEFLCKPPISIPAVATNVHGISNQDVADLPPFSGFYEQLVDFHIGVRRCLAHNWTYDRNMLFYELKRINKQLRFPYPPEPLCSVELTYHLNNHRLNLTRMAKQLLNREHKDAHRAMPDVEMLTDCVRKLREMEVL